MQIEAIQHIQLAMPVGQEDAARHFYGFLLELAEVPKPPHLAVRGGLWFENEKVRIHLGIEADFRPAKKAHPGLLARDLRELMLRMRTAGIAIIEGEPLPGFEHFYVADPFGNRIEFMQSVDTVDVQHPVD